MSKSKKIVLGIASFLPLIFFVIYLVWFFSFFKEMISYSRYNYEPNPEEIMSSFLPLLIIAFASFAIFITLLIIFLVHLVNNKKLDPTERVIWILAFIFFGFISFPVYWYMRIWNTELKSDTI